MICACFVSSGILQVAQRKEQASQMTIPYTTVNGEAYLTRAQAEVYVGHGEKWLKARLHSGKLKRYPLDDTRTRYYKRSELDALLTPQVPEQYDPPYSERDFMTMKDFAKAVGLSYSSVSKLRREGKIKAINVSHNTGRSADYRIHRNDYMRWVEERWVEQQQQQQEKVGAGAR